MGKYPRNDKKPAATAAAALKALDGAALADEDVDDPRQLAEPDHHSGRHVADVAPAEHGQQVVLAEAVERDVANGHRLSSLMLVQRAANH